MHASCCVQDEQLVRQIDQDVAVGCIDNNKQLMTASGLSCSGRCGCSVLWEVECCILALDQELKIAMAMMVLDHVNSFFC